MRRTRELLQRSIKSVIKRTRELLQRSIKSVMRRTRELLQGSIKSVIRRTRELLQGSIKSLLTSHQKKSKKRRRQNVITTPPTQNPKPDVNATGHTLCRHTIHKNGINERIVWLQLIQTFMDHEVLPTSKAASTNLEQPVRTSWQIAGWWSTW